MHLRFTLSLLFALGFTSAAYAQQPFESLGVKVEVLTLSNGKYPEFFPNDSLRRIGSVVYNTRLKRVTQLLPADSLVNKPNPEVSSRWFSPDPLAAKFTHLSPYNFVDNNPVNNTDPDGRDIIYKQGTRSYDKNTGITTIQVSVSVSVAALNQSQLGSKEFASRVADFKSNLASSLSGEHQAGKTKFVYSAGTIDVRVASSMKDVKKSDHLMVMVDDVTGKDAKGGPRAGVADPKGKVAYVERTEGGELMTHEFGHNMGLTHNWDNPSKDDDGASNYMSYSSDRSTFSGGQLYRSMQSELNQGSNSSTMGTPGMATETTTQAKPYKRAAENERVPRALQ